MSIPAALEAFIHEHVDSIESLEILLLLRRASETFWRAEALESHLGMKSGSAEKRLDGLLRAHLVTQGSSGGYRYQPPSEEIAANVSALAEAYAERRTAVVNTVYSENLNRLRAFSNAFKMRSE